MTLLRKALEMSSAHHREVFQVEPVEDVGAEKIPGLFAVPVGTVCAGPSSEGTLQRGSSEARADQRSGL